MTSPSITRWLPTMHAAAVRIGYGNRSDRGADAQAVLMSIFRTLKQRGHDPMKTITQAIHTYLETGQLPPLPSPQKAAE